MPPLIVQPLVENAVLHGVASRTEGGEVEIRARRVGDLVRIDVRDDGPGLEGSNHAGTRTSIASRPTSSCSTFACPAWTASRSPRAMPIYRRSSS